MKRASEAGLTRSQREWEELAKAWLLEILDRTPLEEVDAVPVAWIAREAPPLIADILKGIADPGFSSELALPADGLERLGELGRLRTGERAPTQIPRDLAALQALIIEALRREVPERQLGSFASSVERLAEIFGDIQAAVNENLVRERSGGAVRDELTGLPGEAEMHEWLRVLLAEQRRYNHPFALLLIDVEGLGRVNDAHGERTGDHMLSAVAGVITSQIRAVDRAFRTGGDEFSVLAPHQNADAMLPLAERLCKVVAGSQTGDGPRVAISAGLASCPEHGDDAEAVTAAAEEAMYSAKAAGRGVAVSTPGA